MEASRHSRLRGFAGGELAAADALGDAVLLIAFALVDVAEVCAIPTVVERARSAVATRESFMTWAPGAE